MQGFIYLVCEREFVANGQDVYKIGMTENILKRMRQYPKGSRLLFTIYTDDVKIHEKFIINKFCIDFKARPDIGREYFQGNVCSMIDYICKYINSHAQVVETVHEAKKEADASIVIMEYVDESRDILNQATLKSKELYASFLDWVDGKHLLNVITHHQFTKELKKSFGVVIKAHRFASGIDQAVVFPDLLPCVVDDGVSYGVTDFVKDFITPDKNSHFTLKQAKEVYRESKYFNGNIQGLRKELVKVLGRPCIKQKKINGKNIKNVFEGYTF